jgi:hypothetical protein
MIACAMASGVPSTPELGVCVTGGSACAKPATGASAAAVTAAAAATISGRQRRDTCNLPATKARTAGAVRVTSEAAKPHLRRQHAKRQPPAAARQPRVNGVKTDMVNEALILLAEARWPDQLRVGSL